MIMKSLASCTSVVLVCYRLNVLDKSLGYLEKALLMAHT